MSISTLQRIELDFANVLEKHYEGAGRVHEPSDTKYVLYVTVLRGSLTIYIGAGTAIREISRRGRPDLAEIITSQKKKVWVKVSPARPGSGRRTKEAGRQNIPESRAEEAGRRPRCLALHHVGFEVEGTQ